MSYWAENPPPHPTLYSYLNRWLCSILRIWRKENLGRLWHLLNFFKLSLRVNSTSSIYCVNCIYMIGNAWWTQSNPFPHIVDIHLRSFTSFFNNHVHWLSASQTIKRNEDSSTLWIQGEPRAPLFLIDKHKRKITFLDKFNQLVVF